MMTSLMLKSKTTSQSSLPLVQRKCHCGTCDRCHAANTNGQGRIAVGSSHDPLEREADRVAQRVMAWSPGPDFSSVPVSIQRQATSGEGETGFAPASVDRALAEPGVPLEPSLRWDMEARFGRDFSQVRVHRSTAAADSAAEIHARAYTVGNDLVFGEGEFAPATQAGRLLLAHELTHTVQQSVMAGQSGGMLRRVPMNGFGGPTSGANVVGSQPPDGPLPYREATELAECIRIMGEANTDYCREEVLGEPPAPKPYGEMKVNMKGFVTGVEGTIEFEPDPKACPKCKSIRLVQIVRVFEKPGEDYKWPGAEKQREDVKTTEDKTKGIKAGYFVDHKAASCEKGKGCSLFYRDHWPNASQSQDGSCDGTTAAKASLWDRPFGDAHDVFEFETCAKCVDTGSDLACIDWGFSADKDGKVTLANTSQHRFPSATFAAATSVFNKFYGNK